MFMLTGKGDRKDYIFCDAIQSKQLKWLYTDIMYMYIILIK